MSAVSLIGAGGHAAVALAVARAAGIEVSAIFDERAAPGQTVLGMAVSPMPDPNHWNDGSPGAHIAIGNNAVRQRIAAAIGARWATLIHPSAVVDPTAEVGAGVLVGAGAVIQPEAVIGDHAIVNTGAIVEHHCRIGAFAHIAPGVTLCGGVLVGERSLVGAGATAIPLARIGADCTVGAGATVVSPIPDGKTAIGTPARYEARND